MLTGLINQNKPMQKKWRIAFHEAGHAAGIHLNNKAKQLPPIFFNISFKNTTDITSDDEMAYQSSNENCYAVLEGGRLIASVPPSIPSLYDAHTHFDAAIGEQIKNYMAAFEADIINLLTGPLAEARFVANTDGELFTHQLVNLNALPNYGGSADLDLVTEYLQNLSTDKHQQDKKLYELFLLAFEFVNNDRYWAAIINLAEYVFNSPKNIICCEEIIALLDHSVAHVEHRQSKLNCPGSY